MATLQSILQDVASFINQDPTLPTGTDLTSWTNFVNQSQREWGLIYQWRQLRQVFRPSLYASQTSIALPSNFSKTMSPLMDLSQGSPIAYFELGSPDERYYHDSGDKYIYILGNDAAGYSLNINPPLASGASCSLDIVVNPSSLATYNDTLTCPSNEFIVRRTSALILQARSDPRFPAVKADADDLMAQMIEEEEAPTRGEQNTTPDYFSKNGLRIGEF